MRGRRIPWTMPLVAASVMAVLAGACGGSSAPAPVQRNLAVNVGPAPWPPPERPSERIAASGLPAYKEGGTLHLHTHLDIFVDGRNVPVPENLGLHPPFSPLHTHSPSGILHAETDTKGAVFTLEHLFALWGVRMDRSCVGAYCAPKTPIVAYVDGRKHEEAVSEIRLAPFRQIALVIGTPPSSIPKGYDCHNAAPLERQSCQGFLAKGS
ncbi:MAG TPA: hypothetical protein VNA57_05235 [Acidimicrobiales bacterium]|nr:hypothetical protein [Acidimicrobiales bacterium]